MVTVFATKNLYESALEKFRLRLSSGLLFFFFPSLLPIDRTVTVTADKNLGEQAFPKYLNMPSRIIETLALSLSLSLLGAIDSTSAIICPAGGRKIRRFSDRNDSLQRSKSACECFFVSIEIEEQLDSFFPKGKYI